ncbi:MAG TPA: hypothetical protein VFA05_02860 [Gaiellaceae bacterium]|nr:hypothetical protein [Gaiellaceae bacterium]
MARVLSTGVVLALLAATAAAFAVTEGAKLERSPIYATHVDPSPPVFSPAAKALPRHARNAHLTAHIRFRLRVRERVTVWLVDARGRRVRMLQPPVTVPAHHGLDLVWDGLGDAGLAVPDGEYKPVVKLENSHRTIELPNPITVDTKPPVIHVRKPQHAIISPDGDHHHDSFTTTYRLSEPAHAVLYERGHLVEYTRFQPLAGKLTWNGELGHPPRPVRPGLYVLYAAAQDTAGNVSTPYPFAIIQVRYVVLARSRVVVGPGATFFVRVSTDAPSVRWKLAGRSGVERSGTLRFRAPKRRGRFHLYVFAAGHAARCTVVVA